MKYTGIYIIFNPNSTGSSKRLANRAKTLIREKLPKVPIELVATERAGHGEEIAYNLAKEHACPLLISASGDGGYHDIINGAIHAQLEGAKPITMVIPAGNANDHFRNNTTKGLLDRLVAGEVSTIDVLEVSYQAKHRDKRRYAHSYFGIGMSSKIGRELNRTKLSKLKETRIVLRSILNLRPVAIYENGGRHKYFSVICSNISSMAKYMKLSPDADIRDGKFEVYKHRSHSIVQLVMELLRITMIPDAKDDSVSEYSFRSPQRILLQIDGEITQADANSEVTVTSQKRKLHTII